MEIKIYCQPEGLDLTNYAAVLNFADTPCTLFDSPVPQYWFPIHEIGFFGYSPFYGAAKVYDHYQTKGVIKPLLFHCHGGVNRSPCVALAVMKARGWTKEQINQVLRLHGEDFEDIQFKHNIDNGYIPFDVIDFLKVMIDFPTYSISGLLKEINSPYLFNHVRKGSKKAEEKRNKTLV